ncbi:MULTISPECIES: hypothetical protein [Cyanophyceae]|nr:hypothetical protein [Trichocoleus sp. FACHB-40]MBD2005436.1 hypothetical protein [Trichocoleus sp. FACHB-40]
MNQPRSKIVLIPGASSGIGKTAAQLFAQHRWNVVAKARSPEQVPSLA